MRDVAAAALTVTAAVLGCWALLLPASFAADLGLSVSWVTAGGGYDEHLVRDVGGLYLALAAMTFGLVRRRDAGLDRLVGLAWLTTAVPHLVYHAGHLQQLPPLDAAAQTAALAAVVLLGVVLVLGPAATRRVRA